MKRTAIFNEMRRKIIEAQLEYALLGLDYPSDIAPLIREMKEELKEYGGDEEWLEIDSVGEIWTTKNVFYYLEVWSNGKITFVGNTVYSFHKDGSPLDYDNDSLVTIPASRLRDCPYIAKKLLKDSMMLEEEFAKWLEKE